MRNPIENKRVRKGDKVYIISGNDKGQTGTILSRTGDRVLVQGINMRKKHMKKSEANPHGGVVDMERSIHLSNVRLCVDEKKSVKVKVRKDGQGNRELCYQLGDNTATYRSVKKS